MLPEILFYLLVLCGAHYFCSAWPSEEFLFFSCHNLWKVGTEYIFFFFLTEISGFFLLMSFFCFFCVFSDFVFLLFISIISYTNNIIIKINISYLCYINLLRYSCCAGFFTLFCYFSLFLLFRCVFFAFCGDFFIFQLICAILFLFRALIR